MIELVNQNGKMAVYLLHFDQLVDGARHYIGITHHARLGPRMIEHTTGRGAKLTARACRLRISWRLAHVWRTDQAELEGQLITRAEARQLCPVCRRVSTGAPYRPTKKRPATELSAFSKFNLSQASLFHQSAGEGLSKPQENVP